jgi:hypothetical protein
MGPMGSAAGWLYTDVSGPVAATGNPMGKKMGQASSEGILFFATGDSSIKAGADAGGITKISHVDSHVMSVLGLYTKTTVTVYGD